MCSRKRTYEYPVPQTSLNTELELQQTHTESHTQKEPVVYIRNGFKNYGSKTKPTVVLDGFNMTIRKGIIYGLLGASGCGKTTILGCIMGHKQIDSGDIRIFGKDPTSHNISKRRFGYMPQDTSLYEDFTIKEILLYFGWILGMSTEEILDRSEKLITLLMLPEGNRRIQSFSGGEQRRISLAAALLHEPELLILDEPTVGLDSVLRKTVWDYLLSISRDNNTTIILTTHYIEEVRQAHIVGLMRGGKLLAENPPEDLLKKYGTETLEEVFLKLSISQNNDNLENISASCSMITKDINKTSSEDTFLATKEENLVLPDRTHAAKKGCCSFGLKGNHLKALFWKNSLWWRRNFHVLVIEVTLCTVLLVICCLGIGLEPHDLSVAVVNYETNDTNICETLTCHSTHISCNYFKYLDDKSIRLIHTFSEDNLEEALLHGKIHAFIVIPSNYTNALRSRVSGWKDSSPWDIQHSMVEVFQDHSDRFVSTHLKHHFALAFKRFFEDYLKSCDIAPNAISMPLRLETPIHGQLYDSFTDTLFPGLALGVIFQLAVTLSSTIMLLDRHEVSIERISSIGITQTEMIAAHIFCECLVSTTESVVGITVALFLCNITSKGSVLLVFILTALVGYAGVCYGILVSCVCDNLTMANLMAIGTFFPIIMLSGILWPIEAVHYLLKVIGSILPITRSIISLRSILRKGWGIYSQDVYEGFVIIIIWIAIFLLLTAAAVRLKKS